MFGASTTFFEPIRIGCRIDAQHRADLLASRCSVGIDTALDLRDAFGVAVNHAGDGDRASN